MDDDPEVELGRLIDRAIDHIDRRGDLATFDAGSTPFACKEQLQALIPALTGGSPAKGCSAAAAARLAAGQRFGRYEIERLLGRGGMGLVYLAREPGLERRVALKVLPGLMAADAMLRERFVREAKILAGLSHPGLLAVHELGVIDDLFYYTMEYVEGGSLRQLIDEARTLGLPPGDAHLALLPPSLPEYAGRTWWQHIAEILAQVADALACAHDHDIIHRDIKPANILISAKGRVYLADFGLARCQGVSSFVAPGGFLGTAAYASPEQLRGESISPASDLFSLGVTLSETLTLQHPAGTTNTEIAIKAVMAADFRPPRTMCGEIPYDLETIALAATRPRPADRYANARELGADLRAFAARRPLARRRPWRLLPAVHYVLRRKVAAVIICAALLAGGAAPFAASMLRPAPGQPGSFTPRETVNLLRAEEEYPPFFKSVRDRLAYVLYRVEQLGIDGNSFSYEFGCATRQTMETLLSPHDTTSVHRLPFPERAYLYNLLLNADEIWRSNISDGTFETRVRDRLSHLIDQLRRAGAPVSDTSLTANLITAPLGLSERKDFVVKASCLQAVFKTFQETLAWCETRIPRMHAAAAARNFEAPNIYEVDIWNLERYIPPKTPAAATPTTR